jgi:hypothetical protein
MPTGSIYEQTLVEQGFIRDTSDSYFSAMVPDDEQSLESAGKLSNWHITMIDSDVF